MRCSCNPETDVTVLFQFFMEDDALLGIDTDKAVFPLFISASSSASLVRISYLSGSIIEYVAVFQFFQVSIWMFQIHLWKNMQ